MWCYSPYELKTPLKWGGKVYAIKRGLNELPADVGRAYFLHDFQLPAEIEVQLQGKPSEVREEMYDQTLMLALSHCLLRHGKSKHKDTDVNWLKQFICTETREECEAKVKELEESKAPKGK